MKSLQLITSLFICMLFLASSSIAVADSEKKKNSHTTGIATDTNSGNPNANENATNNSHAKPRGANENGIIHSNPRALPLQGESPTGVPIDGGASVLLAAGAAYGVKRIRDYRKKNKNLTSAR